MEEVVLGVAVVLAFLALGSPEAESDSNTDASSTLSGVVVAGVVGAGELESIDSWAAAAWRS